MSQPTVRRWVGKSVRVKEDRRFVQGRGLYADDIQLKGALYAAVLRSPHAHAVIKKVDASELTRLKGVVAVLTGQELPALTNPMRSRTGYPIKEYAMAVEKAVYAGQPVAAVAAESRGLAEDALDMISVDYEELPAVVDPEEAMKPGAPRIFKDVENNTFSSLNLEYGDVESAFRDADLLIKERFTVHRYSSTPLEPDTVTAHYDQTQNTLTFYSNATGSGSLKAQTRGFPVKDVKVRFVIPDIGGTFGERWSITLQDMTIASLLSWKAGKPVKYVKDRREMLMAGTNGSRDAVYYIEMALKKDGTILGHKLKDITNEGGSAYYAGYYNAIKLTNITGLYKMKNIALEAYSVATNKGPGGSNRGLSKPHMGFVLERMVDLAAKRLNLDPAEIRFRNFISQDELPYITPSGNLIDAGNFRELLEKALEAVNYKHWRKEQEGLRRGGRYIGIGIACNVDPGGANPGREQMVRGGTEAPGQRLTGATVRMDPLGKVTVQIAATNWGQSHETTTSQVVADELGVTPDDVEVSSVFDSFSSPWSNTSGTGADSFTSIDMGAIVAAARKVRTKIQKFAAHILSAKPEEVQLDDGRAFVRGDAERSVPIAEIASAAYDRVRAETLPPGAEPGLHETAYYFYPYADLPDEKRRVMAHNNYGSQVHIAVVEVDAETGKTSILKYVVTHDAGVLINPAVVEGQVHGHVAHIMSATLREEMIWNRDGQMLTATFSDYLKNTAADTPDIEVSHLEYPSPFTATGSKAVGEGPTIPVFPAIANGIEDALSDFGVKITDLPLTPWKVWSLIKEGQKEQSRMETSSYRVTNASSD
ncbi:MAG: xanthine dehydrogenase family protein molybdopterin-binding subunit [Thaumarchaeota archaeon]|nr:xanthine dehydrogenase family protein molybdopterin-binding subunit [Nitrososphaerota archaeon]